MESLDKLSQTAAQVRAAKDGSSTAMQGLFERYLPQVRGIVAARMGRRLQTFVELEDLVQDSMRLAMKTGGQHGHRLRPQVMTFAWGKTAQETHC